MDLLPSTVLTDPAYRMPPVADGPDGLAWLRAHVARFCDGPDHDRRRALVEDVVGRLDTRSHADPTTALLLALGLDPGLRDDVAVVADGYQPHRPASEEADRAADRLVADCGGRTEESAAVVCVLVQAHAATAALVAARGRGDAGPPVPTTRRVAPDGRTMVEVDLADAPFGRGPHRCPGRHVAERLAEEARR